MHEHALQIGKSQPKVPKMQFCAHSLIGIVFLLSRAAVVHLTHVIKGSNAETEGALNASPTALQRKCVEFLVPAPLPLSRLRVSLTC